MDNQKEFTSTKISALKHEVVTFQGFSLLLSVVAQVVTLVFSCIAVNQVREDAIRIEDGDAPKVPPILALIIILELIVQVIELIWYLWLIWMIWGTAKTDRESATVSVSTRYFDWVFTTPLMLINVYFFMWYSKDRCMQEEDLVAEQRYWWLVLIVVADWAMLLVGFVRENVIAEEKGRGLRYARYNCCGFRWGSPRDGSVAYQSVDKLPVIEQGYGFSRFFQSLDNVLLDIACDNGRSGSNRLAHILFGFVFLACAFIPHIYLAVDQKLKFELGVLALVLTAAIWALYGVVFAVFQVTDAARNTCYNLLDIVSKNLTGILVSIVIFNEVDEPPCKFNI